MNMKSISAAFILILVTANFSFGQADEARDAIERGEYVRAANILSAQLAERPTADAYIDLGIAYAHMKEYEKAANALREGGQKYPQDPRFHNELAGLYLGNKDVEAAKTELQHALIVDPNNNYALDLLATISMSEGQVQTALRSWNKSGRPIVDDILHNYYLTFGSWVVRDAVAFHPGGILHYDEWKTTEWRLLATDAFTNVGLEIEPTPVSAHYNAIVRTTNKTNTATDIIFNIVKGLPVMTSYFDHWDLGSTGINFNSNYRWDSNRRRVEGKLKIPLPLPGLPQLELDNTWRSERWNLSPVIRPEGLARARLAYKANVVRAYLKHTPHYRVEIGGGVEYRNRASSGELPELFTDSRNTGKFMADLNLRLADGRYQNRLRLEGFAARRSVLGDMDFSGGTAALNNHVTLSKDARTYLDWMVKVGTSRGQLPVEDYFVLGLDTNPVNPLRGHSAADHGRYGRGPMGTDFVLFNFDVDRRVATIPLLNTFNIPFLTVKWDLFFDSAKTFDRNRIFRQGKLWLDTGAGLRFETPTNSFNISYGRSLRDGTGVLYGYVERRLW